MNKKFISLILILSVILCLNLVSASWSSYQDWYNNYWNPGGCTSCQTDYNTPSSYTTTTSSTYNSENYQTYNMGSNTGNTVIVYGDYVQNSQINSDNSFTESEKGYSDNYGGYNWEGENNLDKINMPYNCDSPYSTTCPGYQTYSYSSNLNHQNYYPENYGYNYHQNYNYNSRPFNGGW